MNDKNTIYGLILMALVFFAFMWFSPKPQEDEARGEEAEKTEQAAKTGVTPDSLSQTEMQWLIKNISDNGHPTVDAAGRHGMRVTEMGIDMTAVGDSIVAGTVTVDGRSFGWRDVVDCNPAAMTVQEQNAAIGVVRNASNAMGRYGRFYKFLSRNDSVKDVKLENDVLSLTLAAKGGVPVRAQLLKYFSEYSADESKQVKNPVVIFEGKSDHMAFTLPLPQEVNTAELYFRPQVLNDSTVLMRLDLTPDAWWGIEYTLPKGESYVVRMRVRQKNMAQLVQSNVRTLGLEWRQDVKRQEKGRMFEERNSGLYYKFAGGSVEHLNESKNDDEERQAKVRWIGFKNQFFSSVIVSKRPFNTADFQSEVLKGSDYLKRLDARAEVNDYDWNAQVPAEFSYFIGPNLYPMLRSLDKSIDAGEDLELTRLIPLGWTLFRWINTILVIPVFSFLGDFISNYGIVILLLTVFIKLILFPLTYKSYKSQAVMRVLAPDIQALNDKYPGQENALKRQQKTMELYSKAGASPMSGCLPMLLQMPILFAMFTFFPSAIELRGQSFLWVHDLAAPDAIISWSGNIPLVTEYFGNHVSLFCLLMTVVNIIYTRINMQNTPNSMPGMKWMMYLMPVMFLVFFNNYAAGLSYYYFLSLLITIIQTYAFRFVIKEDDVRRQMAENARKPRKKSGFMARLEEAQRQQQAMLKEQEKRNKRR